MALAWEHERNGGDAAMGVVASIDLRDVAGEIGCDLGELERAVREDKTLDDDLRELLRRRVRRSWAHRGTDAPMVTANFGLYVGIHGYDYPVATLEGLDVTPALELLTDRELADLADPRAGSVNDSNYWNGSDLIVGAAEDAGFLGDARWGDLDVSVECNYEYALLTDDRSFGIDQEDVADWDEQEWQAQLTSMGQYVEWRFGRPVWEIYGLGGPDVGEARAGDHATPSAAEVLGSVAGGVRCGRADAGRGGAHAARA